MAQGDIVQNKLNKATAHFDAIVRVNTKVNAPTVIHTTTKCKGEPWYPKGFNYSIKDQNGKDITNEAKIVNTDVNEFAFQFSDSKMNGKQVYIALDPK